MVGPKYREPEPEMAQDYLMKIDTEEQIVELKTWWKQFNDPVLDGLIEDAIGHNFDLQIAIERIEEVKARYQFASSNLWPEIDVEGQTIRQRFSQALFDAPFLGPPVQDFFALGFAASWEIDVFGRLRSLKKEAFESWKASVEAFRDVYISLIAQLASIYTRLIAVDKRIDLVLMQIDTLKELLHLSSVRFQAGLRSEIEPSETEATLKSIQALLPNLQAEKNELTYEMAILLGKAPEAFKEEILLGKEILEAKGKIPLGLPSELLQRRPDIRRAESELAAATYRIGAEVANLFPTFSLTGSFGFQSDSSDRWFTHKAQNWSFGPSVFWPLINFGRIRSQIDFSKALQRQALANYEQTVLKALQDVETTLSAYLNEEKRLEELAFQLDSLEKVYQLTNIKFQAGLDPLSTALSAKLKALFVEENVILSRETLSRTLMGLYKSLGGDWSCESTP